LINIARIALENTSGGDLDLPLPCNSETARRVQTISHLATASQSPRTADLANATALRDGAAASSHFAGFFLSSLLILGLLGTLAAFRGVLGEPPSGDAEGRIDAAKLDSYVRDVYRGLSGAFYASMAGVGGTVLLLISRSLLVTGARNAYLSELDAFTEENLIPRLYHAPPPAPKALSEASVRMRSVTEDLGRLGDGLREALLGAQASVAHLGHFSKALGDGAKTLATTFADSGPVERQFTSLAASLKRQEAILEESTAEAGADRASTRETLEKLAKVGDAVVLWQHAAGALLDKFSASQEAQIAAAKITTEALVGGVRDLVKAATEQHERQKREHHELAAFLGKITQAFDVTCARLAEHASTFETQRQKDQADFLGELAARFDRFDSVTQRFETLTSVWQECSNRQSEMLTKFASDVSAASKAQADGIQEILKVLRHPMHLAGNHTTPAAAGSIPPIESPPKPPEGFRRWFGGA
jgi:hypothetical protein